MARRLADGHRGARPGPGRRSARSWCLTLALAPIGVPPGASSRPYTPLSVSIAKADVIAAVRLPGEGPVPGSSPGPKRIQATLLSGVQGIAQRTDVTLVLAPFEYDLAYRLASGRQYVAFLSRTSVTGEYRLADETLLPYDDLVSTRLGATVPLVPRWSDAPAGLASDRRSGPRAVDCRRPGSISVPRPASRSSSGRATGTSRVATSCCGTGAGRSHRTRAGTCAWSGRGRGPWSRFLIPTST